ncbi:MAG: type VI secretion system contractile sheath small subunit [Polyangiaceae bacterium]
MRASALADDDAEHIAGAYLHIHSELSSQLLADLARRHPAFFGWLDKLAYLPRRTVNRDDIFSPRPLKSIDEIAQRELPLRLLVLGEFSRYAPRGPRSSVVEVTADAFDSAMSALRPSVDFQVPNRLEEGTTPIRVRLDFERLGDFGPEAVAKRIPELRNLLEVRAAVTALKGPLGGEKQFRNKLLSIVANRANHAQLRLECGLAPEDSSGALAAAREENLVDRDEAYSTSDPARVAALMQHRSVLVRRAASENPALDIEAICGFGLPHELLEHIAANPMVTRLAASGGLLERMNRSGSLAGPLSLLAPWTEEVRRWAALGTSSLLTYVAVELPLEPGEVGVRTPRRGFDRFERIWRWTAKDGSSRWTLLDWASFQAPSSELDELLSTDEPPQALRNIAERVPWLWRAVATHPACPADVLESLAVAPQVLVRIAVAMHPATPERTLSELLNDNDVSVAEVAHRHLGLRYHPSPVITAQPAGANTRARALVEAALDRLASSPLPARGPDVGTQGYNDGSWVERLLRYRAHLDPNCTDDALSAGSRSRDARDVLVAATHPRATRSMLEPLAAHPMPFIRALAQHRLASGR